MYMKGSIHRRSIIYDKYCIINFKMNYVDCTLCMLDSKLLMNYPIPQGCLSTSGDLVPKGGLECQGGLTMEGASRGLRRPWDLQGGL